jgi:hypothetical protein
MLIAAICSLSVSNILYSMQRTSLPFGASDVTSSIINENGTLPETGIKTICLTEDTYITQTIVLTAGWNLISFAVIPDDLEMISIAGKLINAGILIKIQDEKGNAIELLPAPIGWVDNIHQIEIGKAYKVKVKANTTLLITGNPVPLPFEIRLNIGWNLTGYPLMNSQTATSVFQTLIDDGTLLRVQDETGNTIENLSATAGWIVNIHDILPGEGYKVKVSEAASIIVDNSGIKLSDRLGKSVLTVDFEKVSNTTLWDAYPNPSTDKTTFCYQLAGESKVRLEIYNIKGELVKVLVDLQMSAGLHQIIWDNRLADGTSASSGVYFYRLSLNNFLQTKNLIIH